jgi:hypothetical protein
MADTPKARAAQEFGARFAAEVFKERKGHGGGEASYVQVTQESLANMAAAAFEVGAQWRLAEVVVHATGVRGLSATAQRDPVAASEEAFYALAERRGWDTTMDRDGGQDFADETTQEHWQAWLAGAQHGGTHGVRPVEAPRKESVALAEVEASEGRLLTRVRELICASTPPRQCGGSYTVEAGAWLALQAEAMHQLRELARAECTGGVKLVPPTGDTPFPMNVYLRNAEELAAFIRKHTDGVDSPDGEQR